MGVKPIFDTNGTKIQTRIQSRMTPIFTNLKKLKLTRFGGDIGSWLDLCNNSIPPNGRMNFKIKPDEKFSRRLKRMARKQIRDIQKHLAVKPGRDPLASIH